MNNYAKYAVIEIPVMAWLGRKSPMARIIMLAEHGGFWISCQNGGHTLHTFVEKGTVALFLSAGRFKMLAVCAAKESKMVLILVLWII